MAHHNITIINLYIIQLVIASVASVFKNLVTTNLKHMKKCRWNDTIFIQLGGPGNVTWSGNRVFADAVEVSAGRDSRWADPGAGALMRRWDLHMDSEDTGRHAGRRGGGQCEGAPAAGGAPSPRGNLPAGTSVLASSLLTMER